PRDVVGMVVRVETVVLSHLAIAAFAAASEGGGVVVVVVAPGVVVVVVAAAFAWAASDGTCESTGRNLSSAVWPTSFTALARSFTPGRSITTSLPWREISGSMVPKLSTRLRMMSIATSREAGLYLPTGDMTTDTPPWRSRPSTGS